MVVCKNMEITPSKSLKNPAYPALLAAAAVGVMLAPVSAQEEQVVKGGKPRQVQKSESQPATQQSPNKATREPQRTVGKKRAPQRLGGDYRPMTPPAPPQQN